MKALRVASRILSATFWVIMGVVLLATGIILVLYSQWGQDRLRQHLVDALNSKPGMAVKIDGFRLKFPASVTIEGLEFVQQGDTMIMADTLTAKVRLMPLLTGQVEVDEANLINGFYQLGAPDSAMWMTIRTKQVEIRPAKVRLSPLDINIEDGLLKGARVDMVLNTDTTTSPTDTTAAQDMKIRLGHLRVADLTYTMKMLPTIDSIGINIGEGTLSTGKIDLLAQTLDLKKFIAQNVNAAYIAPDSATVAAYPAASDESDSSTTKPWTITIDSIRMRDSQALYTTQGVTPLPGLDFAYIQANDMDLAVNGFYNQATTLRLPLKLHATERCGLTLDAEGTFSLDSAAMYFEKFNVTTPLTQLHADGMMGMGDLMNDPQLPLQLNVDGHCGIADVCTMFPGYAAYIAPLPRKSSIDLTLDLSGTPSRLNISDMRLALNGIVRLSGKGAVDNAFDPTRIGGDILFSGSIIDVNSILRAFVEPSMGLTVPPMTLAGNLHMHGPAMGGKLTANTLGGRVALNADYNSNRQGYNLAINADKFPVKAFMADLGVGNATLSLQAKGNGFDLMSHATHLDAKGNITSIQYSGYDYKDILFTAKVDDGKAIIDANVHNPGLDLTIDAEGNITGDTYAWEARLDGTTIDLQTLKLSETPMEMSMLANLNGKFTPRTGDIEAILNLPEFSYKGDEAMEFNVTDIFAHFNSCDTLTTLSIHNRDLVANAAIPAGLTRISLQADTLMRIFDAQLARHRFDVDSLQRVMPKFGIDVTAGDDNFVNDILAAQKMSIGHISFNASNDSTLKLRADVLSLNTGTMVLDTIKMDIDQAGKRLYFLGRLSNRPGNLDDFAQVRADGMLNVDNVAMRITQTNSAGATGFDFGAIAAIADSVVSARLFPLNPIIGYKKWTVNLDNYVRYDIADKHIDANLKMMGDDSTIQLYTDHNHAEGEHLSEHADSINNVVLKISDVHLSDWITFNPFAPPISGDLSADINLQWDGGSNINGKGDVALTNFMYDNQKVASLVVDLDVATNIEGTVRASADLMVDGEKTMTLAGNLNDSESGSPFNLDFSVIHFPLATVNPFLPADMARLSGTLNGNMLISGDSANPLINGEIYFDSAAIRVPMTASDYAFSDVKVPVVDNIVSFKDFSIMGVNKVPLNVNGTVDITSMASPKYDLNMKASNIMLVNSSKAARGASVYGKAYINLDATAKGNLNFLDLDADLTVLAGTNVTYIMADASTEIAQAANADMVKFVNLNDTAAVAMADSLANQGMMMAIDAQLTVQNGTTINVELSPSARDRVQLQAEGSVTYTQTPLSADGRLMGRITVNDGYARYNIPLIGERRFNIDQGSYIAFNGDMMNPVLNLHATDPVKVNVTREGQNSRMVNFDILLGVTGTLERMDVVFNLTTDDDLSVANELQSMSAEQRANQAMNMLLYNMYTGPGTTSSTQLTANPLFSFLESQINNWAANNIKGVDLSFGIDQYNQTTNGATSSAMNYSYQVSKSLFNDRFKIVVGGNYTTDTNADENIAENLINDISFEYYLNSQQTMLLKIFRHMGYESILEGEVTQTGVGFVYRRKLDRLGKMLPKFMRPKYRD